MNHCVFCIKLHKQIASQMKRQLFRTHSNEDNKDMLQFYKWMCLFFKHLNDDFHILHHELDPGRDLPLSTRGPFYEQFSIVIQISWKYGFTILHCRYDIATNFCTWHDSTAVMPCAKFHSDYLVITCVTAELILHRSWNGKIICERGPSAVCESTQVHLWNTFICVNQFWQRPIITLGAPDIRQWL